MASIEDYEKFINKLKNLIYRQEHPDYDWKVESTEEQINIIAVIKG